MSKLKLAIAALGATAFGGLSAFAEGATTMPGTAVTLTGGTGSTIADAIEQGLAPYATGALEVLGAIMGFSVLLVGIFWLWRIAVKFFRGSKG